MNFDLQHFIDGLLTASPAVVLMIVLNGIGLVLKRIPSCPDWIIPIILFAIGTAAYPFVGELSATIRAARYPIVTMMLYGAGIGLASVGGYELIDQVRKRKQPPKPPTV